MEILAAILAGIKVGVEAAPVIIYIATAGFGIWKWIKARQYKKAYMVGEQTAAGFITVVETLPDGPAKTAIKQKTKAIMEAIGTEGAGFADLVQDVCGMLDELGIKSSAQDAAVIRAAEAIKQAREKRKKKTLRTTVITGLISLFFLVGCACPMRYTTETVYPGATVKDPLDIAVEYPEGVQADEVFITTVEGRVIAVAPYKP